MDMITWQPKTGHFSPRQIGLMYQYDYVAVATMITDITPIMALRALAEILLNEQVARGSEEWSKLAGLLGIDAVNQRWQKVTLDGCCDPKDMAYMLAVSLCHRNLPREESTLGLQFFQDFQASVKAMAEGALINTDWGDRISQSKEW